LHELIRPVIVYETRQRLRILYRTLYKCYIIIIIITARHSRLMENMLSIFTIFTQCTTCLSSVLWHCRLSVRLRQSGL